MGGVEGKRDEYWREGREGRRKYGHSWKGREGRREGGERLRKDLYNFFLPPDIEFPAIHYIFFFIIGPIF